MLAKKKKKNLALLRYFVYLHRKKLFKPIAKHNIFIFLSLPISVRLAFVHSYVVLGSLQLVYTEICCV